MRYIGQTFRLFVFLTTLILQAGLLRPNHHVT
jgi:hypothetical protein